MKTALILVALFGLYALAGSIEYETELEIAQARTTQIATNE